MTDPDRSTHAARQAAGECHWNQSTTRKRTSNAHHQAIATYACFRTTEVRGSGSFTAPMSPCGSIRPSPTPAWFSFAPTSRIVPPCPARIGHVVPSQRRTTIQHGSAQVDMIEHVMAALAGSRIDNCLIEIDAPECPGCDGSSRVFVEAFEQAGAIEQDRPAPGPDHRAIVHGPRGKCHPGRPSRFGRQPDPLVSPRLRPRFGHRPAELPDRSHPAHVSPRARRQPDLLARDRGPGAARRRHRHPGHPGRCADLRPGWRDRQYTPLCRRMRPAQGSRHGRRPVRSWAWICTGSSSPIGPAITPTPPWCGGCSRVWKKRRSTARGPRPFRSAKMEQSMSGVSSIFSPIAIRSCSSTACSRFKPARRSWRSRM